MDKALVRVILYLNSLPESSRQRARIEGGGKSREQLMRKLQYNLNGVICYTLIVFLPARDIPTSLAHLRLKAREYIIYIHYTGCVISKWPHNNNQLVLVPFLLIATVSRFNLGCPHPHVGINVFYFTLHTRESAFTIRGVAEYGEECFCIKFLTLVQCAYTALRQIALKSFAFSSVGKPLRTELDICFRHDCGYILHALALYSSGFANSG